MSSLVILPPMPIAALSSSRGSNAQAMLTDSPKEGWTNSAAGNQAVFEVDLGAVYTIDSVYFGNTNAADDATYLIRSGVAGSAETAWIINSAITAPYRRASDPRQAFYRRAAPIAARYLRVAVTQPAAAAPLYIGNLAIGLAFQPAFGNEYGSGRQPIDTGAREALIDGGFGTRRGARKMAFQCTMGDLSDDETQALASIFLDYGETIPVLLIEDPDVTPGLQERMHWGLWTRLEPYERDSPGNTRWGVRLEEWR